ncbi:NAD(P)-binding domain-containing protein [Actinomycetospora sp. NBRC 106375]|uniref:NAD(P)-binding domain-containing protein n=1 Tax=Actinomycetospora sp. NBRC 106375 TaxID=3032207 RepID=UPI0033250D1F
MASCAQRSTRCSQRGPMKVGFIGLGAMGAGMAHNLLRAGHDLVVHDLDRERGKPFEAAADRGALHGGRRRARRRRRDAPPADQLHVRPARARPRPRWSPGRRRRRRPPRPGHAQHLRAGHAHRGVDVLACVDHPSPGTVGDRLWCDVSGSLSGPSGPRSSRLRRGRGAGVDRSSRAWRSVRDER